MEIQNVQRSRLALVHAVVSEIGARNELGAWQCGAVWSGMPPGPTHAEIERWRLALLKQPRIWREWRAQVCEPDEIDQRQEWPKATTGGGAAAKPAPIQNPVAVMPPVKCGHCGAMHDPKALTVNHTYPNGMRRHICPACRNPFVSKYPG